MTKNKISLSNKEIFKENNNILHYYDDDMFIIDNTCNLPVTDKNHTYQLDMLVAIFGIKGTSKIVMNGECYTLNPNQVLLCNHLNVISGDGISKDFEAKIFGISYKLLNQILMLDKKTMNSLYYLSQNPIITVPEERYLYLEKLYSLLQEKLKLPKQMYFSVSVRALLQAGLYELLSIFGQDVICKNQPLRQGDILFRKFLEMVAENNGTIRNVSYYADQLCITCKHLTSICKEHKGVTASSIIQHFAIKHITSLLRNPNMAIKEISYYMNFPNLSSFSKYVKKHTGLTPSEYREKNSDNY